MAGTNTFDTDKMTREEIIETLSQVLDAVHEIVQAHENMEDPGALEQSDLFELEESKRHAEEAADRKAMVGTGDRSERIRTYNFPQGRITDHRIGLTLYSLESFLAGEMDEVIDALVAHYQAEALKAEAPT